MAPNMSEKTVEKELERLLERKEVEKHGKARATWYKKGLMWSIPDDMREAKRYLGKMWQDVI